MCALPHGLAHAHCQIRGRHRLVLGGSHPQAPLATKGTHTPIDTLNAHKRQVASIALAELAMPNELKFTQVLTQGVASPNDVLP